MSKATKPTGITPETAWGRSGLMALAAVRYCMGRRTYITSDCADWLIEAWPHIPEGTRRIIQRDLEREIKEDDEARQSGDSHKPLGDDCDRASWLRVRQLWSGA